MQQRALLVLVLLAVPAVASSTSATSAATAWLQSLQRAGVESPTEDQLKQLSGMNPAAFAIVNALLSKHSKGVKALAPEDRGPDVFRRMMQDDQHAQFASAAPRAALPYAQTEELAEVRTPVIDQAHYNPNTVTDRDESSVSRLLAAVASMGGKKGSKIASLLKKRHHVEENALQDDASLFGAEPAPKAFVAPIEAEEQPQVQEQAAAPAKRENSYLKGLDLSGDMPEVKAQGSKHMANFEDTSSNLASFSFDDTAAAAPKPVPKKVAPPRKQNAFLKWLDFGKKAPAPEAEPAAEPQPAKKQKSIYSDFLN